MGPPEGGRAAIGVQYLQCHRLAIFSLERKLRLNIPSLVAAGEAPFCRDRDMLSARLRADLKVYREAVSALQSSIGKDFKQTHERAEHARLAYEAARQALLSHIESHGCG